MRRIVLALALLSGCSFVFVSGPPAHHEQLPYVSCTESRVAPVLDTIFARNAAASPSERVAIAARVVARRGASWRFRRRA